MLALISPAKTLDFESKAPTTEFSHGEYMEEAAYLIGKLKKLSQKQIGKLMSLSDNLSSLNKNRYQNWQTPKNLEDSKQAAWAFRGDVYTGLDADSFSEKEISYAQKHLRMLSGLYGLLKPLDLIQPYRLEMGTRFKVTPTKTNLYKFWDNALTKKINSEVEQHGHKVVINLASNEYFKAVQEKDINTDVITPSFKDAKGGDYRIVMVYAKQARGRMAKQIIKNEISNPEDLKGIEMEGYVFNERLSKGNNWTFTRG